MKFKDLITSCGKEVATGKELKYFWNNNDTVVTKNRNNLIKTLAALFDAEKSVSKIDTDDGSFQVKEYALPNVVWLTSIINYSNRHYLNEFGETQGLQLDVDCISADLDELEGKILDPDSFKTCIRQISQYNEAWKNPSFVLTKPPIYFNEVEGYCIEPESGDTYFGVLATSDFTYDLVLFGALEVECSMFEDFAVQRALPDDETLVERLTSKEA